MSLGSILKADVVEIRKFGLVDIGQLFVTDIGAIGFAHRKTLGIVWHCDITQSELIKAKPGSAFTNPSIRVRFAGKERSVFFTGNMAGASLNGLDKVAEKLPTSHTMGLGKLYVMARLEYMQRISLPDENGRSRSPRRRAREDFDWWLDLLRQAKDFPAAAGTDSEPGERMWKGLTPDEILPQHIVGLANKTFTKLIEPLRRALADGGEIKALHAAAVGGQKLNRDSLIALRDDMCLIVIGEDLSNERITVHSLTYDEIISVTTVSSRLFWRGLNIEIAPKGAERQTIKLVELSSEQASELARAIQSRMPGSNRDSAARVTAPQPPKAEAHTESMELRFVPAKGGSAGGLRLPLGVAGEVSQWLVKPGDTLEKGRPVACVSAAALGNDVSNLIVVSPVAGYSVVRQRTAGERVTSRATLLHVTE